MLTHRDLNKENCQAPQKKIFHNAIYDSPFPELEHCEEFNTIVECNYSANDHELEARFDSMCDFLNKKKGRIEKYSKSLFPEKPSFIESNIDNVFTEKQIIIPVKNSQRTDLLKRNYIGIQREKHLDRFMFFLNTYKSKIKTTLEYNLFEKKLFESKDDEKEYFLLIEAISNNTEFNNSDEKELESDYYEPAIYENDHKDIFYECFTEVSDGNLLIDACENEGNENQACKNIIEQDFLFEEIIKEPDYTSEFEIDKIRIPNHVSGFYELIETQNQGPIKIIDTVKNITHENNKLYRLHMRNINEFDDPKFFLNFKEKAKQEKAEAIADKMLSDLAERKLSEEIVSAQQLCEADKIMSEARMLGIV